MKGLFQCPPLCFAWSFKAFALTGRQGCVRNYPGRCPGLGVSAPSGRVGQNLRKFNLKEVQDRFNRR